MRIVLDTNCLLRTVFPKSDYHCLLSSLQQGRYILCVSTEILLEYEELLLRFYNESLAESVLGFIIHSPYTERISTYFDWQIITADPDDNKFVNCALNGGADYIVSNDKHFEILKSIDFPSIKVIDIHRFKEILS